MSISRAILAALMVSSTSFAQTPREIAKVAFNSVVLLEMSDSNGQPLSLGSGFFVSNGLIATNAHVIQGAGGGTAKLIGDTHKMQILGTVSVDRRADIALLKVVSNAPALQLGSEGAPVVGDKVYVVGSPLGLERTFSEGIVSGLRRVGADSIIQMTAPISPGSSGGPVMNEKGSVIGVAVATFKDGQNLNLAVPVSYISKLLSSLPAAPTVEPLRAKAMGDQSTSSIVDGLGTASEAGVIASNFAFDQSGIGYEFRLSNKLPVSVSAIRVRIIYYDAFKSVMDFEDLTYRNAIPSGLTKTVRIEWQQYESTTGKHAWIYYMHHREDGSELSDSDCCAAMMAPKVEVRIVGFLAEDSQ
jgi:hypothetical protein